MIAPAQSTCERDPFAKILRKLSGTGTGEQRFFQAGYRCAYCGADLLADLETYLVNRTRDHFLPQAAGGKEGDNLVPSCGVCNRLKGDAQFSTIEQAREYIAAKRELFEAGFAKFRSRVRGSDCRALVPYSPRSTALVAQERGA